MKTTRNYQVAAAVLAAALSSAVIARAEQPAPAPQQDAVQKQKTMFLHVDDEAGSGQQAQQKVMLEIAGAEAQVVKGKAYSADTSTETVQTLADGNRIAHRTVSKFYRDSEGRTRREETFGNVDTEHPTPHEVKIFIDDPVAGTSFVLDTGSKSAEKMQRVRDFADVQRTDAEGSQIMAKIVNDSETTGQAPPGKVFFNIQDQHSAGPNDLALVISDENRNIVKEDLGTRNIEGLDCTGTRQTSTIPAGAIGNENPISIVTETWFSSAIGAVVESISDDPRYGKTTYRLTNVQMNEPSRSLFELPSDFRVNARK